MHCFFESTRIELSWVEFSSVGFVFVCVCLSVCVRDEKSTFKSHAHFSQTSSLFKMNYFRQIETISRELSETCLLYEQYFSTNHVSMKCHKTSQSKCSMLLLLCVLRIYTTIRLCSFGKILESYGTLKLKCNERRNKTIWWWIVYFLFRFSLSLSTNSSKFVKKRCLECTIFHFAIHYSSNVLNIHSIFSHRIGIYRSWNGTVVWIIMIIIYNAIGNFRDIVILPLACLLIQTTILFG